MQYLLTYFLDGAKSALHWKAGNLPLNVCNPSEKMQFGTLANRSRGEERI